MTHFHHSNMSHQDYYGSQFVMLGNPKKCFLAQNGMYAIIYNLSRICQICPNYPPPSRDIRLST